MPHTTEVHAVGGGPLTARLLLAALQTLPEADLDRPIEVWLPGSTIRLSSQNDPRKTIWRHNPPQHGNKLLIEGNLNPGSALGRD